MLNADVPPAERPVGVSGPGDGTRRIVANAIGTDDARIAAALTGVRGRVVDSERQPVEGCRVRIHRLALDAALTERGAVLEQAMAPLVAGESTTAADGSFLVAGIWPRAICMLQAGDGADASRTVVTQAAVPGETVDVGDVVLDGAAVEGTVVDGGQPLAGARVRAFDVTAGAPSSFPFERVEPDSLLVVRTPDAPPCVLEISAWARSLLQQVGPATRSDASGRFRLTGLAAGATRIVAVCDGYASAGVADLAIAAGRTQDLGTIALPRGEELKGRVVDAAGRPVAGAEVLAGDAAAAAFVDVVRSIAMTAEDGTFGASGFVGGAVTVAVRRRPGDPWVLAVAQPLEGVVVVSLPAARTLTVRVTDTQGTVARPQLTVVAAGAAAAPWPTVLARATAIDLAARRDDLPDGAVRITDLPDGNYTLTVAPATQAAAIGLAAVTIAGADTEVTVPLPAVVDFVVRVLGPRGEKVRGAVVHVEGQQPPAFCAGRTDDEGTLRVALGSEDVTVSADHPRWGCVHGRAVADEGGEVVLHLQEPGWIEGALQEHGRPPARRGTIAARYLPDVRGPNQPQPQLVAVGADGAFSLRALQPGRYRISAKSSTVAPSEAAVIALAEAWPHGATEREIDVVSGRGVRLELDLAGPARSGPTAHVHGTVQVDGRMATQCAVSLWVDGQLHETAIDGAGRFDFGRVPAASGLLRVLARRPGPPTLPHVLWQQELQLQPGEDRALTVEVATVAIRGEVVRPDGASVAGVLVQASAREVAWHAVPTDARGHFAFAALPTGVYRLEVRTAGRKPEPGLCGAVADVRAEGGSVAGVRIELRATICVAGRIELSDFARMPDHLGLAFWRTDVPQSRPSAWIVADADGSFWTDELQSGTYDLRVTARLDEWREFAATKRVSVPQQGVGDLLVRLAPR